MRQSGSRTGHWCESPCATVSPASTYACPQRLKSSILSLVARVAVESKVNPLNIKRAFMFLLCEMAAFVQHQESEAAPCSLLTAHGGASTSTPLRPRSPQTPKLPRDTKPTSHPQRPRGRRTEAPSVGRATRESDAERGGEGSRRAASLWVAQMKFTSGAAWSKSRWLSVGPRLDAWLCNFKWHTATDHTKLTCTHKDTHGSLVSPSAREKRPRLKCFPVAVTT